MQEVNKVMMFIYREGAENEFFVVHRKATDEFKQEDFVVPTGHVEEGETIDEAAAREVEEELGIKALKIEKTSYKVETILQNNTKHATEQAFLIMIPNVPVTFLERGENGGWHSVDELNTLLSYDGQKGALSFIK